MNKNYISRIASTASGSIEELANLLPEGDKLGAELLSVARRLDERFNLVTITCPVEPT